MGCFALNHRSICNLISVAVNARMSAVRNQYVWNRIYISATTLRYRRMVAKTMTLGSAFETPASMAVICRPTSNYGHWIYQKERLTLTDTFRDNCKDMQLSKETAVIPPRVWEKPSRPRHYSRRNQLQHSNQQDLPTPIPHRSRISHLKMNQTARPYASSKTYRNDNCH